MLLVVNFSHRFLGTKAKTKSLEAVQKGLEYFSY